MKRIAILLAVLLLFACNKSEEARTRPSPITGNAANLAQNAQRPSLTPKALLTDDKLKGYANYNREISSVTGELMSSGMKAFSKSRGDAQEFGKELSKDENASKIDKVYKAALSKSGLTQDEISELGEILGSYIAMVSFAAGDGTKLKQAKAKFPDKYGPEAMLKKAKAEVTAKYGPEAMAVVERHEKELVETTNLMLAATMSGGKTAKP